MATTTNYGWDTPDDTDLVKDGAAAIRTLGSSIDTTTKNLNPETTLGDLAYRSATANVKTRLALGTAGQVLRVNSGGNAPEWATTADQTPLTTKGDLFTFSTVDARLGVGANGTVLTADSAEATGLKWAAPASGGMTLINSGGTALSGSQTITVSVSSDYVDLHIYITDWYRNDGQLYIYFNADTTATNYNSTLVRSFDNGNGAIIATNNPSLSAAGTKNSADAQNFHSVRIPFYNDATVFKQANVFGRTLTPADNLFTTFGNVIWRTTSAITSVSISNDTGNFAGGTMYVYGVK